MNVQSLAEAVKNEIIDLSDQEQELAVAKEILKKYFNYCPEQEFNFLAYCQILALLKRVDFRWVDFQKRTVAMELTILFGDFDSITQYLSRLEKKSGNPLKPYMQVLEMVSLKLEGENDQKKYTFKIWQVLAKKYMPSKLFERVIYLAHSIEKYVDEHRKEIEEKIKTKITDQLLVKFTNEWDALIASVDGLTQKEYIEKNKERREIKLDSLKEVNKQFRIQTAMSLGIHGPFSEKDINAIKAYQASPEGVLLLETLKAESAKAQEVELKRDFENKIQLRNRGKEKYVQEGLKKELKQSCHNAYRTIFSEHTPLAALADYAAMVYYSRAEENPAAAKLFFFYGISEDSFNNYLALIPQDDDTQIPSLTMDGAAINHPNYIIEKMPSSDPMVAMIGNLLGCCQRLEGEGEACVIHNIISPYGGLYIMREKDTQEIVAASWAWRGQHKKQQVDSLVFDSIESRKSYRDSVEKIQIVIDCFTFLAKQLVEKGIAQVLVGTGGDTPEDIGIKFDKPVTPKDYANYSYRDSRLQRLVWASPTVDPSFSQSFDKKLSLFAQPRDLGGRRWMHTARHFQASQLSVSQTPHLWARSARSPAIMPSLTLATQTLRILAKR